MRLNAPAAALAVLTSLIALTPGSAFAYTSHNDLDKRPVEAIAGELGVAPETFVACFYNVVPDGDFNPSGAQQRSNKAILLPCLQKANASITNDQLDTVMNTYRGQHI